jgi:lipid-binding SYLF domain-containing protein
MKTATAILAMFATTVVMLAGCTTEPTTVSGQESLDQAVQRTMAKLSDQDPSLPTFLGNAYAYVVFPTVGKGAFVVGGGYGHGEVFQGGKMIGYADISQATVGAQVGAEAFAELIAFRNSDAFAQFKDGKLALETTASAVILKSGTATSTIDNKDGFVVFVDVKGGAMAEAQIGGQSFSYQPL